MRLFMLTALSIVGIWEVAFAIRYSRIQSFYAVPVFGRRKFQV